MLVNAGLGGLTVNLAVSMAHAKGRPLNPNSVSGYLSKFKSEGLALHDGERYYLASLKKREANEDSLREQVKKSMEESPF